MLKWLHAETKNIYIWEIFVGFENEPKYLMRTVNGVIWRLQYYAAISAAIIMLQYLKWILYLNIIIFVTKVIYLSLLWTNLNCRLPRIVVASMSVFELQLPKITQFLMNQNSEQVRLVVWFERANIPLLPCDISIYMYFIYAFI